MAEALAPRAFAVGSVRRAATAGAMSAVAVCRGEGVVSGFVGADKRVGVLLGSRLTTSSRSRGLGTHGSFSRKDLTRFFSRVVTVGAHATSEARANRSSRVFPATAPECDAPWVTEVNALAEFITRSKRLLVITGAGCSTESNVPDYRSPKGAYSTGFKPMTHQDFTKSEANQKRYWARSFFGWRRFAEQTAPNDAHRAVAALQEEKKIYRLITQNVDRLHQAGGSVPDSVLELHGTAHEVVCVRCEHVSPRPAFQKLLAELNPEIAKRAYADVSLDDTGEASVPKTLKTRPDGDVEVDGEIVPNFVVPKCKACGGGPLKPKVVFFGDSVPVETHARATEASQQCDAVLIIGSSVSTFSAFRLVRDAAARNVPVAILTKGETRADDLAQLKVEKLAGETLPLVLRAARRMEMYGY